MFLHPSDMAGEEINSHLCAKYLCLLANVSKLHQHAKLQSLLWKFSQTTINPKQQYYSSDRGKC